MKIVLFATVACMSVMSATAAAGQSASPTAAVADAPKEKKVCHTEAPVLGSNIVRRTCKTPAQWAQQQHDQAQSTGQKVDVDHFRDVATQFAAPR